MTITAPRPLVDGATETGTPGTGRLARVVRGRPDDPVWVRPSLLVLLAGTGVLYIVGLDRSGWANSFYAAAVQAGTKSWKAFLFGSFDSSNFITVDKPPASLWVMELSARIFGLNSWSLLVPQALEGVATVAVLFATVRRVLSPAAGLLAGVAMALTPVAVLMFRDDNPDALLLLLLVCASWATVRYLEAPRARWLVAAGGFIGLAFLTKSLQAFLVLPAIGVVVIAFAPTTLRRRIAHLLAGVAGLVVASGWWLAVVQLTPAADRPYVGGSQDNSEWNLIFGYNGFGRLTGNETGSVGGGGGAGGNSMWGPTGITRLFNSTFGGQISWLLPAALVLLVAGLVLTRRAPRTDRVRASLVLFGLVMIVTGLTFSLSKGIIHPYYTIALSASIGAVCAIGAVVAWRRRRSWEGRIALAAAAGVTAWWSSQLLHRSPSWLPWLRTSVLVVGLVAAVALLLPLHRWFDRAADTDMGNEAPEWGPPAGIPGPAGAPRPGPGAAFAAPSATDPVASAPMPADPAATDPGATGARRRPGRTATRVGAGIATVAVVVGLAGPTAYALDTVRTAHTGAIPSAGPTVANAGFGGFGGGFGGGGRRFRFSPGRTGTPPTGSFPGGGTPPAGGFPGGGKVPSGIRNRFGGGAGGGAGGLLGSTTPSAAVQKLLKADASRYKWVAAVTGAESASGYQLATREPVMAIGGFNGSDPAPSLASFEAMVRKGEIHYYIGGSTFGGGQGGSSDASAISTWVTSHFKSVTVGGVTLYDLTARTS